MKSSKESGNFVLNFICGYLNFNVVIGGLLQVHSAELEETRECCAKEVSNSNFFLY
jgi:hypothetical protein